VSGSSFPTFYNLFFNPATCLFFDAFVCCNVRTAAFKGEDNIIYVCTFFIDVLNSNGYNTGDKFRFYT
jgi:hypothetical protein